MHVYPICEEELRFANLSFPWWFISRYLIDDRARRKSLHIRSKCFDNRTDGIKDNRD
jgi:hypothetical protein